MSKAYIALGSNLGDKFQYLQQAISILNADANIEVQACSSIYETPPVGYSEQDSFYNMVVQIETTYTPEQLLSSLQSVELKAGRVRSIKNGPRTLDLDILLFDEVSVNEEHLQIPHPRMHERLFVIVPLADVLADYKQKIGQPCVDVSAAAEEGIVKLTRECRIEQETV